MVLRLLGDAGVVGQRIDAAVARGDGGDLAAVGVLGHVALGDLGFGAGSPHGVGGRLGLLQALGAIEDHRLGAALGCADRDGRAETRGRAGHQNDLAVEVCHCAAPDCSDFFRSARSASARIFAWSKARSTFGQSSTHSAAAASSPALAQGAPHAGEEHDRAGVASGIAAGIGIDTEKLQLAGLDPGFLQKLPPAGVLHRLADLDEAAGQCVLAFERWILAPHQQHAPSGIDHHAIGRERGSLRPRHQMPRTVFTCFRPSWCWL